MEKCATTWCVVIEIEQQQKTVSRLSTEPCTEHHNKFIFMFFSPDNANIDNDSENSLFFLRVDNDIFIGLNRSNDCYVCICTCKCISNFAWQFNNDHNNNVVSTTNSNRSYSLRPHRNDSLFEKCLSFSQ